MSNVTPIRPDDLRLARGLRLQPAGSIHVVGLLSAPSRAFASFDVDFRSSDVLLSYTFWERDVERSSGVYFDNVQAFKRRADIYSTAWHLEAYDRVVEIGESAWVEELRDGAVPRWRDHWSMRHFMVYIDGEGTFEVVAEDVLLTPDVAV